MLPDLTPPEWRSVLHVAHTWGFPSLHELSAARFLPHASPIERVVCGHTYGLPQWLLAAYTDVCVRAEWLSAREGVELGVEDVVRVGEVRERMRLPRKVVCREFVIGLAAQVFAERLPPPALASTGASPRRERDGDVSALAEYVQDHTADEEDAGQLILNAERDGLCEDEDGLGRMRPGALRLARREGTRLMALD